MEPAGVGVGSPLGQQWWGVDTTSKLNGTELLMKPEET